MMMTLTTCLLALLATAGGGEIRVRCKTDAQIRGVDVQLRDLADVDAADPVLAARLLQLSFGRRPATGFSRILTSHDVLLRLVQEGVRANEIRITGAREIVLHPLSTMLKPREILDVAAPALRAVLGREVDDVEFEPSVNLDVLYVPPGRRSMDLRARLRKGSLRPTSVTIEVAVLVDDLEFRIVRVPFRLRHYQHVIVAARTVKRGAALNAHNVRLMRVEMQPGSSPFLTELAQTRGKVAARDLRAGQKLTLGSAVPPAVIRTGDPVSLVAARGAVRVTTRAIARQDGAVGGRIQVANLTSGRIVQAIVLGPGVVTVTPGIWTKGAKR